MLSIEVNKDLFEQDSFGVWIKNIEQFSVGNRNIYFKLNAEQLDKLGFECNATLQDSERKKLDK